MSPFPDMSANGIDALSHTWDFPGVLYAFHLTPLREFLPGSVDCPRMAQADMVQLPRGVANGTRSTSPPRTIAPPAGEFHTPVVQNVQASRLDVVRDGYRGQGFSTCAASFLAQSVRLRRVLSATKSGTFSVLCVQRDRLILFLFL